MDDARGAGDEVDDQADGRPEPGPVGAFDPHAAPTVVVFCPAPLLTVAIETGSDGGDDVHLHAGESGSSTAAALPADGATRCIGEKDAWRLSVTGLSDGRVALLRRVPAQARPGDPGGCAGARPVVTAS